jgi:hypothetical protein
MKGGEFLEQYITNQLLKKNSVPWASLLSLSSEVMTDKSRGVWNEAVKFAWNVTQNKISGLGTLM